MTQPAAPMTAMEFCRILAAEIEYNDFGNWVIIQQIITARDAQIEAAALRKAAEFVLTHTVILENDGAKIKPSKLPPSETAVMMKDAILSLIPQQEVE